MWRRTQHLNPNSSTSTESAGLLNDPDLNKNEGRPPMVLRKRRFYSRPCFWLCAFLISAIIFISAKHSFELHICDGRCFFLTWRSLESRPVQKFDFPCHVSPFHPSDPSEIHRHIHQSWKTNQLPTKFVEWSTSWKQHHPNWTYHLWTDQDNRDLVEKHYPWFLPFYDSYPKHIMRVDAVRYLYLHAYGGIYADLDLEALKPLDEIIRAPVVLGWLTQYSHGHELPNAFMAASHPGHPFWLVLLAKSIENQWLYSGVEQVTGPHMLTDMVNMYIQRCHAADVKTAAAGTKGGAGGDELVDRSKVEFIGDLQLLPAGMIYPFSWVDPGDNKLVCSATSHDFNATECKARFPGAYTITYWTHSWGHSNILLQY